jgi:hypothetical protein
MVFFRYQEGATYSYQVVQQLRCIFEFFLFMTLDSPSHGLLPNDVLTPSVQC